MTHPLLLLLLLRATLRSRFMAGYQCRQADNRIRLSTRAVRPNLVAQAQQRRPASALREAKKNTTRGTVEKIGGTVVDWRGRRRQGTSLYRFWPLSIEFLCTTQTPLLIAARLLQQAVVEGWLRWLTFQQSKRHGGHAGGVDGLHGSEASIEHRGGVRSRRRQLARIRPLR